MEAAAERFEVVRHDDEGSGRDEGRDPRIERDCPDNADRHRPSDREGGEQHENALGDLCSKRPPIELVQRVSADPHGEEEGRQRRQKA